jgi:ketosteroid isomerase-like protein
MHTTSPIVRLVRAYYAAYESKDRQALEAVLSGDFSFNSPVDDHLGRDAYFRKCWPNSEKIRRFHIERIFDNGDEVVVRYECERLDGLRFRCMEFFTAENGKLREQDVYFGHHPERVLSDYAAFGPPSRA